MATDTGERPGTKYWESLWQTGIKPGELFDRSESLPELQRLLMAPGDEDVAIPTGGRVGVPGCGRGYDVVTFCRSGKYDEVIGIEISETARDTALEYLRNVDPELPSTFHVINSDFLKEGNGDLPQSFDLIYDYTFFCALDLEARPAWAQVMINRIRKGGCLITVMFPYADNPDPHEGPPFQLNFDAYHQLLHPHFVVKDKRKLGDDAVHGSRKGRTWWCLWERV